MSGSRNPYSPYNPENMAKYFQYRNYYASGGNPYANDEGYTEKVLVRGGSGTKTVSSLKDQYTERVQELNNYYYENNMVIDQNYVMDLVNFQNELGYYPDLDPRMQQERQAKLQQEYVEYQKNIDILRQNGRNDLADQYENMFDENVFIHNADLKYGYVSQASLYQNMAQQQAAAETEAPEETREASEDVQQAPEQEFDMEELNGETEAEAQQAPEQEFDMEELNGETEAEAQQAPGQEFTIVELDGGSSEESEGEDNSESQGHGISY